MIPRAAAQLSALEAKLGPEAAPGRCALAARFRKVIEGRPVVDEDFVAVYPCQAAVRWRLFGWICRFAKGGA